MYILCKITKETEVKGGSWRGKREWKRKKKVNAGAIDWVKEKEISKRKVNIVRKR